MGTEDVATVVEGVGVAVEALGVVVIVAGVLVALGAGLRDAVRQATRERAYRSARRRLGAGILLGLELLVAGDIIRTVAVEPTFRSVGVLAVIVLIRTFLSFTLEVELTGRPPWRGQRGERGERGERAEHAD